jgi:hypothetical protein
MKENDIMLGDWVRRRWTCTDTGREVVKDFQVTEIHKLGNFLYAWGKSGNMGRVEQLEPIPLTAEILEKNGFEKSNQISDTPPYYMDEDGNIYYSLEQNGVNLFWGWWQLDNVYLIPANAMGWLNIKYIHQLQHALRLYGIDLDIVI